MLHQDIFSRGPHGSLRNGWQAITKLQPVIPRRTPCPFILLLRNTMLDPVRIKASCGQSPHTLVAKIKPNIINICPKINTLISSFNFFKGG